jgi:hypothetical protein
MGFSYFETYTRPSPPAQPAQPIPVHLSAQLAWPSLMSATASTLPEPNTTRHRTLNGNGNGNGNGSTSPEIQRVAPFDEQVSNEKNPAESQEERGTDFAAFVKFENERFKEFRYRLRGKHLDHVPGPIESIVATIRCSGTSACSLPACSSLFFSTITLFFCKL